MNPEQILAHIKALKVQINPKNPLLWRHWKWIMSSSQGVRYLHEWSTAYNEHIIPLDWLPDHGLVKRTWHENKGPGMALERGSNAKLTIRKIEGKACPICDHQMIKHEIPGMPDWVCGNKLCPGHNNS
jgi:hypothetical protein